MILKESIVLALFSLRFPLKIEMTKSNLNINNNLTFFKFGIIDNICLLNIHKIKTSDFPLKISLVEISFNPKINKKPIKLLLFNKNIKEVENGFKTLIRKHLRLKLTPIENHLSSIKSDFNSQFPNDVYIRGSQFKKWKDQNINEKTKETTELLTELINHPLLDNNISKSKIYKTINFHIDFKSKNPMVRYFHNKQFINLQKKQYSELFNQDGIKLNEPQIEAVLAFDDANLCIAAAGSGKTAVLVSKIVYAIESNFCKPDEILALAFNTDTISELQSRLSERLKHPLYSDKVDVKTFHSMGNYFFRQNEKYRNKKIKQLDTKLGSRLFFIAYDRLLKSNPSFQNNVIDWIAYNRYTEPLLNDSYEDLKDNQKRYQSACKEQIKDKITSKFKSWQPPVPTLNKKVFVRSLEEAKIVNWLTLHNVDFQYEFEKYDFAEEMGIGKTLNGKQIPYCPDFSYKHPTDKFLRIYHEHFGLDENGSAPEWLGGKKYVENVNKKIKFFENKFAWKKKEGHVFPFFFTTSSQFKDNSIFDYLYKQLEGMGIIISKKNEKLQSELLNEFRKSTEITSLFIKYIQIFRDSGLSFKDIREKAKIQPNNPRSMKFLDIIEPLVLEVNKELENSSFIEYSDMLKKGAEELKKNVPDKDYKLILIDEFQDTAKLKMDLVLSIVNHFSYKEGNKPVVFMVGDDWQAINRFAGSDIAIFNSYISKNVKTIAGIEHCKIENTNGDYTHIARLENTYRSVQGIANVARKIVLKNTIQIDKSIISINQKTKGTLRIIEHFDNLDSRRLALETELKLIASNKKIEMPIVFIITRNKVDEARPEGVLSSDIDYFCTHFKNELEIHHYNMHKSKGLEADYVIIAGMDEGYKGFPSLKIGEPLFDLVLPKLNDPLEEERRLFYVALTRAKYKTILLTAYGRHSRYINEFRKMDSLKDHFDWSMLLEDNKHLPTICPKCNIGNLTKKYGQIRCTCFPKCIFRSSCERYPRILDEDELFSVIQKN